MLFHKIFKARQEHVAAEINDLQKKSNFALDTSRASRDEAFDMDGMGVLVIKKRAKEFFYRRYQGFNTLIIKI